MIRVKVCGLTDADNARQIARTGIDFAGFIYYPASKRYVGIKPEMRLFENIPPDVCRVGVFVNEDPSEVVRISREAGFNIVQLHGNEDFSYCRRLKASGFRVIKAFRIGKEIDPEFINLFSEVCDYYLFDTESRAYGGSGKKFNWKFLNGIKLNKPFFLSGGIGPDDVHELKKITNSMFYAVDINSRFEISPGIKDVGKVKVFVERIKTA